MKIAEATGSISMQMDHSTEHLPEELGSFCFRQGQAAAWRSAQKAHLFEHFSFLFKSSLSL